MNKVMNKAMRKKMQALVTNCAVIKGLFGFAIMTPFIFIGFSIGYSADVAADFNTKITNRDLKDELSNDQMNHVDLQILACPFVHVNEVLSFEIIEDGLASGRPRFARIQFEDGSVGVRRLVRDDRFREPGFGFWFGERYYFVEPTDILQKWRLYTLVGDEKRSLELAAIVLDCDGSI
jgi:hypothetical protein